ncbi:MAG: metalloprotease family protein [Thermoproteota archaeon]
MLINPARLLAVVLTLSVTHELIHILVALILGVRIEELIVTWFGVALYLRDEDVAYSVKRLTAISLSPLTLVILGLSIWIYTGQELWLAVWLSLLGGSLGDLYLTTIYLKTNPLERIKISQKWKNKLKNKALYTRKLS